MINEDCINRFDKLVRAIIDWNKPDGVLEIKYELMYDGDNEYVLNLEFVVSADNMISSYYSIWYENEWSKKIILSLMNYLNISIIDGENNIVSYDGLYDPEHYIH